MSCITVAISVDDSICGPRISDRGLEVAEMLLATLDFLSSDFATLSRRDCSAEGVREGFLLIHAVEWLLYKASFNGTLGSALNFYFIQYRNFKVRHCKKIQSKNWSFFIYQICQSTWSLIPFYFWHSSSSWFRGRNFDSGHHWISYRAPSKGIFFHP